jgi:phage terminase large subunit-like protein
MTELMTPAYDARIPSLGPQVCRWIQDNLVFGPGDRRGERAQIDVEKRSLIRRMYEIYPQEHSQAGRRRFKRVGLSLAKGLAKTELAAWIAAAELHPDAPVRCVGWDAGGQPIGGGVTDPYVVLVAYTEEQSDELAYGALRVILEESPLRGDFDIGLERIMRRGGDGKAVSLASAPNARDGARTTFQVFDETHWMTLSRLKQAHQTMMANLPKRKQADAWMLEVTTAYEPGAGSIAEATMDYARAVADGRIEDARLFYFHRQASETHDLATADGARAAVVEASGPAAGWRDIDSIVELWRDPTTDRAYWERVWCNRPVQGSQRAFDVDRWRALRQPVSPVQDGDLIVLGFDGALFRDATGIVATHVSTGYQWVVGVWECPLSAESWQVPADEVDDAIGEMFSRYDVWRLYADPPYWQSWVALWAGRHGGERVLEWWTNRRRPMTAALEAFHTAIDEGTLSHDGNAALARHLGNAHRQDLVQRDMETGRPLWLIRKERPDSPHKIDLAMAAVLSWEARNDAIAAGVLTASVERIPHVYIPGVTVHA